MPDFDLDAALTVRPAVDVFVYTQTVIYRGDEMAYHLLMLGPLIAGCATCVAQLSVSTSGWVSLAFMGPRQRWRRMRQPAEIQALAELEAEVGPTEAHAHSRHVRVSGEQCRPVMQWWREVGGQSA